MTATIAAPPGSNLAEASLSQIEDTFIKLTRGKADLLRQIRHFEEAGLARLAGASSTAHALIRRLGISDSTAYEYVNIACRLGTFPLLEQAFGAGEVSYSKVRLVLPYITEDNEAELVELARELGYHELEIALVGRKKNGDGEDSGDGSYLRIKKTDTGDVKFWGQLNPVNGAAFIAGLKLGEISWNGVGTLDESSEEGQLLDDDALDRAMDKAAAVEPVRPSRQTASGFGLPIGKHLVHALMGMVHMVRTKPTDALLTPAAHVNIIVTKDGRAYMPNNIGAPSQALANIVANAALRQNIVDENGLVIKTGRKFRLATPAQINALLVMWGSQCAAPGCTHTRFLEMHHLEEWNNGGHTDLENLLPLCSACHSLVTDGYIKILRDEDDLHFVYGDGSRFVSRNYSLPRRNDDAVTMGEFCDMIDAEDGFGDVGV